MKTKKIIAYTALGVGVGAGVAAWLHYRRSIPKNAVAVKPFDLNRYLGKWYEIARYDYFFENNLNNTTAEYSLNTDGTVQVLNRGYNYKTAEWKEAKGKAKFVGDSNEGRLKVSFFGPLYSGYNVIAIDPNYRHALVAGRNLDYLWLLSRDKVMPEDIKNNYLQIASELGYDTSQLIWVKHNT